MKRTDGAQKGHVAPIEASYSADEVGEFFGALASARDQFGQVTKELSREYGIGPRGPWMVGLIGREPASPHQLASFYGIGRSLVTAELKQLQNAGLIYYSKSANDGRKVELSLTEVGVQLRDRLTEELGREICEKLRGYSKEEVMACAQLLGEFARGNQYAHLPRGDGSPR